MKKSIKLGVGFATGRKSFRKTLNSYIASWRESQRYMPSDLDVSLNLFVAYDVEYSNTKSTDYTNLSQEIVDSFDKIVFLGAKNALKSLEHLSEQSKFTTAELRSVFSAGYAGKRNTILYAALENNIDYLIYLDDDEYPMAVTNNKSTCLWSGQRVLDTHLQMIQDVDITNGHHCGYISPIPQIKFNDILTEVDFRMFIEAISNDIIRWDNVKRLMESGGVTYADTAVLAAGQSWEVSEEGGCKFISGANLCLNLSDPTRTLPFYNPPGARGEDTFLSTLLSDRIVRRVPCYAFHDGFSNYLHLLEGMLPTNLMPITASSPTTVSRFLAACIGWVRYKPLLVYITRRDSYEQEMKDIRQALIATLPKLASYFEVERFMDILEEFDKYSKNAKKHYEQFQLTQRTWEKLVTEMQ